MKKLFSVLVCLAFTGSLYGQSQESIVAIQQAQIRTLRDTIQQMSTQLKALDSKAANLELMDTRQTIELTDIKAGKSRISGPLVIDGNTSIDAGSGWHRSYGDTGWYNGTYGGGWHMIDSTWIRSYGSKSIYSDQTIRADNGFQVDGIVVIDGNGRLPQLDAMKSVSLYNCPCTGQITTAPVCFQFPATTKPCDLIGTFLSR
ncbi:MAG TPA: shufflon system plasmid conjugative transfer pilus tip adhesin PilV [Oligoflexus sp.]|uniref:shufflon system plasmid conjugative transfer pilus tip adhesin PilV n=1 Tax=Oligoflexus sp. TaxID=1971216 RepID=UPI002D57ECBD|nr:shufflon system plasmid conjugative transfer pilus tip adhesin PilV [Oligoflexus sp.]HYX33353.1 shufflon system plasmid conjugative transfer pilus tip adhesin PilV [Oligoflexus sp.]